MFKKELELLELILIASEYEALEVLLDKVTRAIFKGDLEASCSANKSKKFIR